MILDPAHVPHAVDPGKKRCRARVARKRADRGRALREIARRNAAQGSRHVIGPAREQHRRCRQRDVPRHGGDRLADRGIGASREHREDPLAHLGRKTPPLVGFKHLKRPAARFSELLLGIFYILAGEPGKRRFAARHRRAQQPAPGADRRKHIVDLIGNEQKRCVFGRLLKALQDRSRSLGPDLIGRIDQHDAPAALVAFEREKLAERPRLVNQYLPIKVLSVRRSIFGRLEWNSARQRLGFAHHVLEVRVRARGRHRATLAVSAGRSVRLGRFAQQALGKSVHEVEKPRSALTVNQQSVGHRRAHCHKLPGKLRLPGVKR